MEQERLTVQELWKRVEPEIDELVRLRVRELLPGIVEVEVQRVTQRTRKDIADELVRILLEKAFLSGNK